MNRVRVVELFAGVGGFHIGFDRANRKNKSKRYEVVWSNQWEPATKAQQASRIYEARFGEKNHSNEDIEKVLQKDFESIPKHDLLVGGFPCQDYSVARTLSHARGLIGEKGVLWWSIYTILKKQGKKSPKYLMLENVDRLLKSPATQRGRDFAVMLASLSDLGYAVEWRVINAADYGMPQRRRRVFIVGYKAGTPLYNKIKNVDAINLIAQDGTIADAFPVTTEEVSPLEFKIEGSLAEISKDFSHGSPRLSPFANAGVMIDRHVWTMKTNPQFSGNKATLGSVLQEDNDVSPEFFIDLKDMPRWEYLKGGKRETRKAKNGHTYQYSEGGMLFPDPLDKPSRTIVTGEGGSTPSRFKHVIKRRQKYRRLTPIELERLNMFPDNHTELEGVSSRVRAFLMGNALVVGVIEKLGQSLLKKI